MLKTRHNSFTETDYRGLVGLTVQLARRYHCGQDGNFDEYVSAGLVGAAQALQTYDPARGASLVTWAAYHIRSRMNYVWRVEAKRRCRSVEEYEDKCGTIPDPSAPWEFQDCNWEQYLRHLTPGQRRVFELHFIKGLEFAQVARRLKISKQAVTQAYYGGVERLRDRLAGRKDELCAA